VEYLGVSQILLSYASGGSSDCSGATHTHKNESGVSVDGLGSIQFEPVPAVERDRARAIAKHPEDRGSYTDREVEESGAQSRRADVGGDIERHEFEPFDPFAEAHDAFDAHILNGEKNRPIAQPDAIAATAVTSSIVAGRITCTHPIVPPARR
jgi:hypothetical protein